MPVYLTRTLALGFAVLFGLAVPGATSGFAQMNTQSDPMGGTRRMAHMGDGKGGKSEPSPPVLPGTKAASDPAAPTKSAADMSPTEALFDAINRGDLQSARGAVNRGANLKEINALGLTPIDQSVDLGRNDITFMLLSQRGDDSGARRPATRTAETGGAQPQSTRRVRATRAPIADYDDVAEQAAPVRRYSADGGAPIPSAGFLGFNGR